jgi:hypothetical protein
MDSARRVLRALGQVSGIMPPAVDHDTLVTVRADEVAVASSVTACDLRPAALAVEEVNQLDQVVSIQVVEPTDVKRSGLTIPCT